VHVAVAERSRRKGLFTDLLVLLEEFDYGDFLAAGTDWYVRIDKVMNPVLDECLPKKGYTRIRSRDEAHFSYQKIIRHDKDLATGYQQDENNWLAMAAMPESRNQDELYTDHS
jgi:hypothetical protein